MALTYSSQPALGTLAPDFSLPGVDGKTYSLKSFESCQALLVIFMCNHCPYVIAVQDRINELAKKYRKQGLGVIGINPNDPVRYPDDSFDAMKQRAEECGFVFPYVQDLTQSVARAYDARCTPDPYLFQKKSDGTWALAYQGRIDDSWKDPTQVKVKDLELAVEAVLNSRKPEGIQHPAMGCSIKWKSNGS